MLGWQLAHTGVPTGVIATIQAAGIWPQTWKWAWAPLVDTTLGFRRWHVIGCILSALTLVALACVPPRGDYLALLSLAVVVSSAASSVVSMAAEGLMAVTIEDGRRGIASGWATSGNLGGVGVGGGLALYLGQHLATPWLPGAIMAAACVACVAALPLVGSVIEEARPPLLAALTGVARALWQLVSRRAGLLVLFLMLMPIGSGGAQQLWAAIAGDWHASATQVALVNGALGGVVSLIGCVAGGALCDRLDRKTAYCLYGLALGVTAVAMAVLPRTSTTFVVMTLVYAFVLGTCYAAYTAVVLEVIGTTAAATKFQLLSAASNVPIALITGWDGQLHDWRGAGGMLWGEAAIGAAGVALFGLIAAAMRVRGRTPAPA